MSWLSTGFAEGHSSWHGDVNGLSPFGLGVIGVHVVRYVVNVYLGDHQMSVKTTAELFLY